MATIEFVTVESPDTVGAARFYAALGLGSRVRLWGMDVPSSGFRGFTLSVIASQPGNVDSLITTALEAGASQLKPAAKSLWGYGGVVRAPDGTILTVASSSKKDTAPAAAQVDDFVLQLGVEDVSASKQFYVNHGFEVSKSYGKRYVEFDTGPVKLNLNSRRALARAAGVSADGSGSHRLTIRSTAGSFTDPDGFVGEPVADDTEESRP
jgi:predicted lactoylglutathione lyase